MKSSSILLLMLFTQLLAGQEMVTDSSTICWDTSFSMRERDLGKEFEILDKIFARKPNQTVQLLLFNIAIVEEEFQVVDGNWAAIKERLIASKLDGATIYSGLADKIKNEKVYFFTDGNRLIGNENLPLKKGDLVVNSTADRDEEFLKKTALIGRARLMDLAAMLPTNQKTSQEASDKGKPISGTIYLDNVPTANIEVRLKGKEEVYTTDESGKFTIPGIPGDSILFSSKENRVLKMLPVGYFSENLTVFLKGNVTTLDEVVVTEKRVSAASADIATTGYGKENKEKVGYAVQSIRDEQITDINTDISRSVQNRFSNVSLGSSQDLTKFTSRSNTSLLGNNYGLVVVDGVPVQQSDSSRDNSFGASASFIDPENVESITVLKGYAATNRYGALGNGGVILVTTKNARTGKAKNVQKDLALVQDNIYNPNTKFSTANSPVINALTSFSNVDEAYEKYLELRNFNENNEAFYLDSFSYFKDKDAVISARILSNLCELHPENISYLKVATLASRYVADFNLANTFNKEHKRRAPMALEPFYVEGVTSIDSGNYQNGLEQLSKLAKGGTYGSLNPSNISKTLGRDLKNLIHKNREALQVAGIEKKYFTNEQMNIRLVLQWSNSATEFNVQFVNPKNRFFTWEHTNTAIGRRIRDEVQQGFAMEEFEIYDDLKGDWKINAEFLGNLDSQSNEPLVFLCTLYTNFGYPSQTKEHIWVYFTEKSQKSTITQFTVN